MKPLSRMVALAATVALMAPQLQAMPPRQATPPRLAAPSLQAAATFPPAASRQAAPAKPVHDPDSGAELLGKPAPAWSFDRWIRTRPLDLARLRGKVVLLRWWTEGCHFCAATLPVLEQERKAHERDGLVVIGVYHPKPPHEVSDQHVLAVADQLGFSGPLAVDTQWRTLERYWLDGHPDRNWTSVSFLIDRGGNIRWVHGGGEYHPSSDPGHSRCNVQFGDFEQALATVLAEPAPKTR